MYVVYDIFPAMQSDTLLHGESQDVPLGEQSANFAAGAGNAASQTKKQSTLVAMMMTLAPMSHFVQFVKPADGRNLLHQTQQDNGSDRIVRHYSYC